MLVATLNKENISRPKGKVKILVSDLKFDILEK